MFAWPTYVQLNIFGYDNYYYGDAGVDGVLDHLPPNAVAPNYITPPYPILPGLVVDDTDLMWTFKPRGQSATGATMYAYLLAIPIITGILAVVVFIWSLYDRHQAEFPRAKSAPSSSGSWVP